MSWHLLPSELLLHIITDLGPAFFREDVRRLLVSKQWYDLARPVLLRDLVLSEKSLRNLIAASQCGRTAASIQSHVTTVTLGLDGFNDWPLESEPSMHPINEDAFRAWTREMDSCLAALGNILRQCPRLQSLRLEAQRGQRHIIYCNEPGFFAVWQGLGMNVPGPGYEPNYILEAESVASLVTVSHLSCLEVDTAGVETMKPMVYCSTTHLCLEVNAMLPTLRRLRLRMVDICPSIMDLPATDEFLRLEDIVINLCANSGERGRDQFGLAGDCRDILLGPPTPMLSPVADMEQRARELALRMKRPRIVRVLSPFYYSQEIMMSFDALTGRRSRLPLTAAWDADGDEVEEESSDSHLSDDQFDEDGSSTRTDEASP